MKPNFVPNEDNNGQTLGTEAKAWTRAYVNTTDMGNAKSVVNVGALAAVATSGSYADLQDAPVLASVATSGSYADLQDIPQTACITLESSTPVITIAAPAIYTITQPVTSLVVNGAIASNTGETTIVFSTGDAAPAITFEPPVNRIGDITAQAGKSYVLSILAGFAVMAEYTSGIAA